MKWVRRSLLFVALFGVMLWIAWSLKAKPIPVETTKVMRGPFVETVEEPGKTRVRERFVVSAPVAGELSRITIKPGDAVNEGDVVATIKPVSPAMQDARTRAELAARLVAAEAAKVHSASTVEKANALKKFAETELARIKGLVERGALPGRDLEKAELDLLVAEKEARTAALAARVAASELEVARAAASSPAPGSTAENVFALKAPLSGRVLRVMQTSAGVVAMAAPLIEIADPSDLEVVVPLLTADAVRIAPGARSLLERWGGDKPLEGRVRTIEPAGYTKVSALGVEEQRVDVVIDLVSPPAERKALGDGFRVYTRTIIRRTEDVVKTSSAALFRDGDRWALFIVDGGRARKRFVEVERRSGLEAMIQGVDTGATVVAFPASDLADGKAVAVIASH
jgi:HlyD family secretion protein